MSVDEHRFLSLDLHKNNLGDEGVRLLMSEIRHSQSIIYLNLASNEITNEGMITIFKALQENESVISLNLSTIDGVARNRISATGILELKRMLQHNHFLEQLDLSSIGLGNEGLIALCEMLSGPVLNNPSNMESSPDFAFMKEHHHLSLAQKNELGSDNAFFGLKPAPPRVSAIKSLKL